jgi:hypothetical protein
MTDTTLRAVVLTVVLAAIATGTSRSGTAAAPPVSIPFEWVNRHIVLKVSVNGSRPLPFVLDTGAKRAIVKLDRAKELGLALHGTVTGRGAGPGQTVGSQVRNATFTVPGVAKPPQPLTLALPLANLAPSFGQDVDGIVGGDFIEQFVVELDFQTRTITLHDRSGFTYAGRGESVSIQFDANGHPTLSATVTPTGGAPIDGTFLLDIGSGGALVLHSPFVEQRRLLNPQVKTIRAIGTGGAGGEVAGRLGRVAELKIGAFAIKSPITLFAEDRLGAFANPAAAGNIGNQIASRFKVFLDYARKRVILEPLLTLNDPFDRAFSGIALRAEGPDYRTFRIRQVLEDSAATDAGLQIDDIITAVDGRPAADLTLTTLAEAFERPGTYELTVRRGDSIVKATLTPRKPI